MHDVWDGHYHDHDEEYEDGQYDLESNSSERITLNTVGIDIGSSTTHLIFSKVVLVRKGKQLSSRFVVVERDIVYESPIYMTPYKNPTTIDTDKLKEYFDQEYVKAGQSIETVDTGAVIVTGEAAMKENAENIISLFSMQAGKFVCATAGPNLEAILAAHGSGAVSRSSHQTVLNVDIGGGTTKFALIRHGQILDTSAISLGARLMAWDNENRLHRIEKTAYNYIADLPEIGGSLSEEQKIAFVREMADSLFEITAEIIGNDESATDRQWLYITSEFKADHPVEEIIFSGGVSEFIYNYENVDRGDFGLMLGEEIKNRVKSKGWKLGEPVQRIRATVIGASQYTVQLSGNTIFLSHPSALPIRNIPVLSVDLKEDDGTFQNLPRIINDAFQRFDLVEGTQAVALGVKWPGGIHYEILSNFCRQLRDSLPRTVNQTEIPLIVVLDDDIAGLVGQLLQEEFAIKCPVVSIDQVDIRELDYIDIGELLEHTNVVPVVIKSLVFK